MASIHPLAAPFAVGAAVAVQAVRNGDGRGLISLPLHLTFTVLATAMPISESLAA